MGDIEHVGAAEAVPGVHHAILAERDIDARVAQFRYARQPAPARVSVVPPLQRDVDERIGDDIDAGFGDQRDQLRDIVIVHRMHRSRVARRRAGRRGPAAAPRPPASRYGATAGRRSRRNAGRAARPRLAAISHSAFTERRAIRHRALEMRDAADDVDAEIERALQIVGRARRTEIAVLREGDELQVEIGRDLLLDLPAAPRPPAAGRRRHRHGCGSPAVRARRRDRNI